MGRLLRRFLVLVVTLLVLGAPGSAPAALAAPAAGVTAVVEAEPAPHRDADQAVAEPADDDTSLESDADLLTEEDADDSREAAAVPPSRPLLFLPSARLGRARRVAVAPPLVHLEIPKPPPRA